MMLKPAKTISALVFALALGATTAWADVCPPVTPPNDVQVDGVTNQFPLADPKSKPADWDQIEVQLGSDIYVHVKNLKAALDCQKLLTPKKELVLFLKETPISNLVGTQPSPLDTDGSGFLHFKLVRATSGDDNKEVWLPILGRPWFGRREVSVSIGIADQYPITSTAKKVKFRTVPPFEFALGLVFMIVLFGGFCYAVCRSNILRDAPAEGVDGRGAFSLSKSQSAVWFFVILGGYVVIAAVTGEFNGTLTGTAVTLLGIGAATAAGSAVVSASQNAGGDADKQKEAIAKIKTDLEAKRTYLTALTGPLAGTTPTPAAITKAKAELDALERLYKKATNQSIDFINDILSDANGINFHRFQMVGWTLVLAFIFMKEVWEKLGMPTFDGNLLALQGLSAATFVGLKMTEPTVPSAAKT